jgi:hypothetical protein
MLQCNDDPEGEAAMIDKIEAEDSATVVNVPPSGQVHSPFERDYTDGQIAILRQRMDGQHAVTIERFNGIDKATALLSETVTRVPTELQQAVTEILRLMDERDLRVQARFDANEKLSKTESELNQTALAAALAAQEKASAVSTNSLEARITGQGSTTDRTIEKNAELAAVAAAALGARVTQLTDQLVRVQQQVGEILAAKVAMVEQKTDTRGGASNIYGAVGMVTGILSIVIVAVTIIIGTR